MNTPQKDKHNKMMILSLKIISITHVRQFYYRVQGTHTKLYAFNVNNVTQDKTRCMQ